MSMRIAYYTGWLRPEMEGTSREVFPLAEYFGANFILGLSKHESFRIIWKKRAFGFNPKAYIALKLSLPILERTQQLSHIYDTLGCWHYLRNLGNRPLILTATSGRQPLPLHLYKKVSAFVVDSEHRLNEMIQLGFPRHKLKIIYPGIDIKYFRPPPSPPPIKPFKVLFATAPPTVNELHGRGVWQILEAAKRLPGFEFILLWRPWGNSLNAVRNRIKELSLSNVTLINKLIPDMRCYYHQVHCVLAPFREGGGKSCPTSILEALACGLPVIVGKGIGIRSLLINEGTSLYSGKDGSGLAEALQSVQQSWETMMIKARKVAERYFSLSRFFNDYKILYRQVINGVYK